MATPILAKRVAPPKADLEVAENAEIEHWEVL